MGGGGGGGGGQIFFFSFLLLFFLFPGYEGVVMATPSETQGSIQKELTRSRKAAESE